MEKIRSSQSIGYWHIPLPLVCNIVHSLIYDKHWSLWRTNFIFNYLLIPLNVILQAGFCLGSSIRLTMRETLKLTSLFGLNLIHRRTSFCLISGELSQTYDVWQGPRLIILNLKWPEHVLMSETYTRFVNGAFFIWITKTKIPQNLCVAVIFSRHCIHGVGNILFSIIAFRFKDKRYSKSFLAAV